MTSQPETPPRTVESDQDARPPRMPGWVKAVAVLVLILAGLALARVLGIGPVHGGGGHGTPMTSVSSGGQGPAGHAPGGGH